MTTELYCTPAELRTQIGKSGATGTATDAALNVIIAAASRAIDNHCNRPQGFVALTVATAKVYTGRGLPWIYIDEFTEVTAVAVKDSPSDSSYTAWAADDYIPFSGGHEFPDFNETPYGGLLVDPDGTGGYTYFTDGRVTGTRGFSPTSYRRAKPTVQVTAKWGYAETVPSEVKQACLTQSARWWKRGETAWGDATANGDMGQVMYTKALDPGVKMLLTRLIKPAIGAF